MSEKFSPRAAQEEILAYRQGTMGVSAVPGSGKTWTLSLLAARLIESGMLSQDQEVLIVTLVNSAVTNFSLRISAFLKTFNLVPSLGYRVRTLHGLAHDIVKERPDLAGLDTSFQIIDEREAERIRIEAIYSWLKDHRALIDTYLIPDLNSRKKDDLIQKQVPDLLDQAALQFIRTAKNLHLSPQYIENNLGLAEGDFLLARMGQEIYRVYQRNLEYRGAVDFDDLISHAYKILTRDSTLLARLQEKWPYILEDEAQDSSLMQQEILSLLASKASGTNWVRVGDPNQAIYETFTTADPQLLISFIENADYNFLLPNSGRSTETIIDLANYLVNWTSSSHPLPEIRNALFPNLIEPTPSGDSQQNPISEQDQVHLYDQPLDPDDEIDLIASSAARWLEFHPDETAAVLAPRNERGKKLAAVLRSKFNIEPIELLNTTLATRKTTGSLVILLNYLLDPGSSKKLSAVYRVWLRDMQDNPDAWDQVEADAKLIGTIHNPELYIAPGPSPDWLSGLSDQGDETISRLIAFAQDVNRWQEAVLLPIDQLILTLANDLFQTPEELSLAYRIASFIKGLSVQHPDWDLPALLDELKSLARNERRFFSSVDEVQFNPEDHKGKVVVTTAHKSKGLEWDRVYLMAANNYNFPSGSTEDTYIAEKWFVRDGLNLPAESLAQLSSILPDSLQKNSEGTATKNARLEYIRERLRLLYVSITRAKKELIITWNTGKNNKSKPAAALLALIDYLSAVDEP
jgi:DNA helicase-2/ATP-dependent DNA helicase PcrA